jgi:hypothetical protein
MKANLNIFCKKFVPSVIRFCGRKYLIQLLGVRYREKIIDRIKLMIIRCMYCDYPNPISLSAIEYETKTTGSHADAFLICPEFRNKFMIKI